MISPCCWQDKKQQPNNKQTKPTNQKKQSHLQWILKKKKTTGFTEQLTWLMFLREHFSHLLTPHHSLMFIRP